MVSSLSAIDSLLFRTFAIVLDGTFQSRRLTRQSNIGTNPGCDTVGFSAVSGWDPVTGLGTPNFPKMLKYYLSLP